MERSQEETKPSRWLRPFVFLVLILFVLVWLTGFALEIVFLALLIVMFVALHVFPGPHVVILLSSGKPAKQSSTDQADRVPTPAPPPPTPFKKRLAQFLKCDENALDKRRADRGSKMKYWSAVSFGPRHDPKPTWWIRGILKRIHKLVHG